MEIEKLKELLLDRNITLERVGSWLWLSGDTYPIKEQLKELGFFYSKNKKSWYYNGSKIKYTHYISKYKNLNEVRNTFGYEEIIL